MVLEDALQKGLHRPSNKSQIIITTKTMAEDELSDVVGGPEEMVFKLTFERKECIRGRELDGGRWRWLCTVCR